MQQINVMLEPAKAFLNQLVTFLPAFFLAIAVLVITSYSIHYTKLYETLPLNSGLMISCKNACK